uniref:Bestrophin homolog n=1 Tax=Macrostomum lignano TaxID=282301 RepID=A0A1I8IS95_9PLAT
IQCVNYQIRSKFFIVWHWCSAHSSDLTRSAVESRSDLLSVYGFLMPTTPQSMMRTRFFGCAFDGFVGTSPIVLTTSKPRTTLPNTTFGQGDVELRAVGVRAVVGHGNPAGAAVRQDEGLIVECLAEDAGSAGAVLAHHVAHLNDEVRHNAMHRGVLVVQHVAFGGLPAAGQGREVHRRSGGVLAEHGDGEPAGKVVAGPVEVFDLDLEPDLLGDRVLRLGNLVGIFRGDRGGNGGSKSHQNQGEEGVLLGATFAPLGCLFVPAVGWVLLSSVVPTNDDGFCWGDAWVDAKQRDVTTGHAGCCCGEFRPCRSINTRKTIVLCVPKRYRDCDSLTSDRRWNYSMSAVSSTLTVWFYQRCGNSDKASIWLVKKHANSTRACTEFEADSSYNSKWFEAMAVSYASQIYTDDRLFFVRLLFRWAGSVWQLLWIDYLIFTLMYVGLAVLYFNLLYTHAELKATFEVTVAWLKAIRTSVPLSFMLGFFVSAVFGRWWSVCTSIPWLHSSSFYCQALVDSPKTSRSDLARKLRITVLRYLNLAWILMMAGVSLHIKERFGYWQPKWRKFQLTWQRRLQLINSDSKVQKYFGQLVTDKEMQAFAKSAELSNDNDHSYDPEYWLPLMWATRLIRRAKNLGCIADERQYLFLVNIINNFRGNLGTVWMYTEFNIPLVYTQVAVTAVYLFLASTLISTQLVDSDILLLENFPSRNGTVTRTLGLNLLSYLPVIGSLEFIFYLGAKTAFPGWFKIGMCLLNPMGKDKADIPMSDILNSNLKASVKIGGAEDSIFPGGLTDSGEAEEAQ